MPSHSALLHNLTASQYISLNCIQLSACPSVCPFIPFRSIPFNYMYSNPTELNNSGMGNRAQGMNGKRRQGEGCEKKKGTSTCLTDRVTIELQLYDIAITDGASVALYESPLRVWVCGGVFSDAECEHRTDGCTLYIPLIPAALAPFSSSIQFIGGNLHPVYHTSNVAYILRARPGCHHLAFPNFCL